MGEESFSPLNVVVLLREQESRPAAGRPLPPLLGHPGSRPAAPGRAARHDHAARGAAARPVLPGIAPGDVLWDVGAGSGSVALEAARLSPGLAGLCGRTRCEAFRQLEANVGTVRPGPCAGRPRRSAGGAGGTCPTPTRCSSAAAAAGWPNLHVGGAPAQTGRPDRPQLHHPGEPVARLGWAARTGAWSRKRPRCSWPTRGRWAACTAWSRTTRSSSCGPETMNPPTTDRPGRRHPARRGTGPPAAAAAARWRGPPARALRPGRTRLGTTLRRPAVRIACRSCSPLRADRLLPCRRGGHVGSSLRVWPPRKPTPACWPWTRRAGSSFRCSRGTRAAPTPSPAPSPAAWGPCRSSPPPPTSSAA